MKAACLLYQRKKVKICLLVDVLVFGKDYLERVCCSVQAFFKIPELVNIFIVPILLLLFSERVKAQKRVH